MPAISSIGSSTYNIRRKTWARDWRLASSRAACTASPFKRRDLFSRSMSTFRHFLQCSKLCSQRWQLSPLRLISPQAHSHRSWVSTGTKRLKLLVSSLYWRMSSVSKSRWFRSACTGRERHFAFSPVYTLPSEKLTERSCTEKPRTEASLRRMGCFAPNMESRAALRPAYSYSSRQRSLPSLSLPMTRSRTALMVLSVMLRSLSWASTCPLWLSMSRAPAAITSGEPEV